MKFRDLLVLGIFLVCFLQPHHAYARGPSTPEERAKVVQLARALEREPLAEDAAANRQWLRQWIAEVPDIRFKACADLLSPGLDDNYPYLDEVNLQVLFSGAALTLEDQAKARDDFTVYAAGVEGALRVYEALLKSTPDAKSAYLEDLVAKRNEGQLYDYVSKLAAEKCKRFDILLIAAPAGASVGLVLALLLAGWFGKRDRERVALPQRVANETRPRVSELIVLICATCYVIVAITLHLLMPEYDPRFRFMSEYAWGAYGWLMTTTFFVLALAIVTVAFGLREIHQSTRSARVGFGLLLVGAAGVFFAGVFREFVPHSVAGAIGLPSLLLGVLLSSWTFRKAIEWQSIYLASFVIALGMLATLLSIIFDVGMPGLQQRVFLFLVLVWLVVVVHRIGQVRLTRL